MTSGKYLSHSGPQIFHLHNKETPPHTRVLRAVPPLWPPGQQAELWEGSHAFPPGPSRASVQVEDRKETVSPVCSQWCHCEPSRASLFFSAQSPSLWDQCPLASSARGGPRGWGVLRTSAKSVQRHFTVMTVGFVGSPRTRSTVSLAGCVACGRPHS